MAVLAGFAIGGVIAALAIMMDERVDRSMPMALGLVLLVATALFHSFVQSGPGAGSTVEEESVHPIVWTIGGLGMGAMIGAMTGDILVNMGMGLRG